MIHVSDNAASNTLITAFGMDTINATMQLAGMTGSRLGRHFADVVPAWHVSENVITPADTAGLLYAIERGAREAIPTIASPQSCRAMIEVLFGNDDGSKIVRGLPPGTPCAHKTGEIDGVRNDAGIVDPFGDTPYVLVVLTKRAAQPERRQRRHRRDRPPHRRGAAPSRGERARVERAWVGASCSRARRLPSPAAYPVSGMSPPVRLPLGWLQQEDGIVKKLAAVALTVGVATASCSGGHGGGSSVLPQSAAQSQGKTRVTRSTAPAGWADTATQVLNLTSASDQGALPAARPLTVRLGLGLHNVPQLQAAIAAGQTIAPAQFAATYGPTAAEVQQVDRLPPKPGLRQRHRRAQPPARQRDRHGGPGERGLRHDPARVRAERQERLRQHQPGLRAGRPGRHRRGRARTRTTCRRSSPACTSGPRPEPRPRRAR